MNPDDVVRARVVIFRASKYSVPKFLLMNLVHVIFEDAFANVEEQIAQPCGSANITACRYSLNQEPTDIDQIVGLGHALAASL